GQGELRPMAINPWERRRPRLLALEGSPLRKPGMRGRLRSQGGSADLQISPPQTSTSTSSSERKQMISGRSRRCKAWAVSIAITVLFFALGVAKAEDGYRLWLRYDPLPKQVIDGYRPRVTAIVAQGGSATMEAIREELAAGFSGLLGGSIPVLERLD